MNSELVSIKAISEAVNRKNKFKRREQFLRYLIFKIICLSYTSHDTIFKAGKVIKEIKKCQTCNSFIQLFR